MSLFLSQYSASVDPSRPSFFELWAESRLVSSLKPALHHLLKWVCQHVPTLKPLADYFDEWASAALLVVEKFYLDNFDGSFAEQMYGLKRVKTLATSPPENGDLLSELDASQRSRYLTRKDRYLSLLFLVVVPYVKGKLDAMYRHGLRDARQDVPGSSSVSSPPLVWDEFSFHNLPRRLGQLKTTWNWSQLKKRAHSLFMRVYPLLSAAHDFSVLVYYILYLFGDSAYFMPSLHAQGLVIERQSMQDFRMHAVDRMRRHGRNLRRLRHGGVLSRLLAFVLRAGYLLADYSRELLLASSFVLKLLEWYYARASDTQYDLLSNPGEADLHASRRMQQSIPPPAPLERHPRGHELPDDKRLCPLCLEPRREPCALPSGYVFCKACILPFVAAHQHCPITFEACSVQDVRRLFLHEGGV